MGLVGSSWKKKTKQSLTRSDKNLLASSAATTRKGHQMDWSYLTLCVLNAYLSNSATMLNIVAIYAIRKTSSLSKSLKTLLLSLAVSDLGVGLLAQPMYVAYIMDSQQNNATNDTNNVIYLAFPIPVNLFIFASLFSVMALGADRFLAIYLHLRYQELVTHNRVAAVVVSIWVISALISLIRLFLPKNIMYVSFVIIISRCLYHSCNFTERQALSNSKTPLINQIHVPQVGQNDQGESVKRKRRSSMASLYVYLVFIVC